MKPIELNNLSKRYDGGTLAVDRVSLRIETGELFFLLGPSGCGKTTLLRMIAGLIDPTDGTILLGDRDVTRVPVEKRNTAMVFQNYALWPHMTVRRNVEFGPRMRGLGGGDRKRRCDENLQLVRMDPYAKRKPNQLSGGQQQRVALARALAAGADCLLLDEPLSNLDAKLRAEMRTELRRLVKTSGATAVYVTHDQKEALSMADRIAVMDAGRLAQVGTPEELYNRPATRFVADFLGEANFLQGTLRGEPGRWTLETSCGRLAVAEPGPAPQSDREVRFCVRPERIELLPPGASAPDGAGTLSATVSQQVYLGEVRQYTCRLADGTNWRVSLLGDRLQRFAVGDEVWLRIPGDDVVVLGD
jgi:iron(III) transport system ATP-binding protein